MTFVTAQQLAPGWRWGHHPGLGASGTTLVGMESVGHNADPGAPAPDPMRTVAAIVVITEPSPELPSTLRALIRQDAAITVLVVDDASQTDPTSIIAESAPDAFVSRLDQPAGWAGAANAGAALVQGATWLLITHDDVAPAPDAVREMVDLAVEHDADMVVPKLVSWHDHERLLSVGFSADRTATAISRVDVNELDQGQNDFVRSTVAADSCCVLVRATVFRDLGGFTAGMTAPADPKRLTGRRGSIEEQNAKRALLLSGPDLGEATDLCWRILRAGGKAMVAPSARVAHGQRRHRVPDSLDQTDIEGRAVTDPASEALRMLAHRRNRVATVFSTLRGFPLLRAISALIVQRFTLSRSGLPLPAVKRLLVPSGLGNLRSRRQLVAGAVPLQHDDAVRLESQLVTGDITIRKLLGREVAKDSANALSIAGDAVSVGWRRGPIRLISGLFLLVVLSLLVGSRSLLGGVPSRGQFTPIPGLQSLLRAYANGKVPSLPTIPEGGGVPGLLIASLLRVMGLGQNGFVGFLSTTLLIPLGVIGAARLGSAMAKAGADSGQRDHSTGILSGSLAAALYGATPGALAALRSGSWEALLLYGALPWILFSVLYHGGELRRQDESQLRTATGRTLLLTSAVRVGLPLAILSALTPVAIPVVVASVLLLWIGARVGGTPAVSEQGVSQTSRHGSLFVIVGALIVTLILFAGWLGWLVQSPWMLRGRGATSGPLSIVDVFRFAAPSSRDGSFGVGGWLTLGIPLAAIITMLVVNELRLWWALRWWMVAIGFGVALWIAERDALVGWFPSHEVLAVPFALSLVLVVTIGISGVTQDIGRAKFGWRQTATVTAIASVIVSVLPLMWSARSGTWGAQSSAARTESGWIADVARSASTGSTAGSVGSETSESADSFSTLWIGTNETVDGVSYPLPVFNPGTKFSEQARWSLGGTSPSSVAALWGAGPKAYSDSSNTSTRAPELASLLEQAASGATFRFGALVPHVKYIVIAPPVRSSPSSASSSARSAELDRLADGLNQQLDLRETDRRGSVTVLENTAFVASTTIPKNAGKPWTALRWLQLLFWSGASVAFLADWSTRRRRLDQLAADFDDLEEEPDSSSDDAWDTSLTVQGAFRSDDEVYADVFEDAHGRRAAIRSPLDRASSISARMKATSPDGKGRMTQVDTVDTIDISISDNSQLDSAAATEAAEPESLADQLWSEWSARHGRSPKQSDS